MFKIINKGKRKIRGKNKEEKERSEHTLVSVIVKKLLLWFLKFSIGMFHFQYQTTNIHCYILKARHVLVSNQGTVVLCVTNCIVRIVNNIIIPETEVR